MPNQEIDNKSKEQDEKDGYVSEDRPGLGLGFGMGSGLGFNSGNAVKGSNRNDDSDENDDDGFLPTAFGKKIKEGAMRREKERERERLEKKRGKHQSVGQDVSGDVGKFEKHTTGELRGVS